MACPVSDTTPTHLVTFNYFLFLKTIPVCLCLCPVFVPVPVLHRIVINKSDRQLAIQKQNMIDRTSISLYAVFIQIS